MYYPQPEKEPSGCAQTVIITRVIFSLLLPPILVILGSIGFLLFALYLFTVKAVLVLIPAAIAAVGLFLFALWERSRAPNEPPDRS
jgi:hypothetical protein